jgi:hypothetical protein
MALLFKFPLTHLQGTKLLRKLKSEWQKPQYPVLSTMDEDVGA